MDIENVKWCCVTGHRDISGNKAGLVERELRREIQSAIDDGFSHFISGFADGVDLIFVKLIIEYREKYPKLFLEAALPYPAWLNKGGEYNALLEKCNGIGVQSKKYSPNCFLVRNRYMVNTCERVIAVYDGREKGGTVNTIRYASALERDIKQISI